jgi:hypothetical protein
MFAVAVGRDTRSLKLHFTVTSVSFWSLIVFDGYFARVKSLWYFRVKPKAKENVLEERYGFGWIDDHIGDFLSAIERLGVRRSFS